MRGRHVILISIIVSMLAPVGAAQWVAWQTVEPDNAYDTADFMWPDAPGGATDRVYFAAVSYADGGTTLNPNVAALRTNNEPAYGEYHEALLGVWTDCNGDGYIGMAEGALREYPSSLLLDATLCPAVDGAGTSPNKWIPGANNYRKVVTEFIPIAREPTARDLRVYRDDDARVWGDFGRHNTDPTHRSCALNPQPRGTYQSTGGTLNYVDCRVDVLGTWNLVAADATGMRFANVDDAEGSFADFDTFGTEDTAHSPVYVWDCSDPYLVRSGDVLNDTGLGPITADRTGGGPTHDIAIWGVDPRVGNTQDPTAPALYNETREGLEGHDNGPDGDGCDTSNDRGADFYGGLLGEDDFNGVDPRNKREADWNFVFVTSNRGGAPVSLLGAVGGSGNAGMNENDAGVGEGGSRWVADSRWLSKPGPSTVKADLQGGNVGLADAYWLTFYAFVGDATTGRFQTPGGSGTYGSWHCGDHQSGIHHGWNCDKTTWYVNPDGTRIPDEDGELVYPGQRYNLRDTDCYDGNAEPQPGIVVGLGAPAYGDAPCP